MTTDTTALQEKEEGRTMSSNDLTERIAEELYYEQYPEGRHRSEWPDAVHPETVYEYRDRAAAVLPIIAVEVRKAKAEAFDEGWKDRARRDVHRAYAFIDERRNVPGPPASLNPYRETGDSDEHR